MGDFNEIFLGNQKNFRGCLENVYFNNIDVMTAAEEAMASGKEASLTNIQWECAEEFEASSSELHFAALQLGLFFVPRPSYKRGAIVPPDWIVAMGKG